MAAGSFGVRERGGIEGRDANATFVMFYGMGQLSYLARGPSQGDRPQRTIYVAKRWAVF